MQAFAITVYNYEYHLLQLQYMGTPVFILHVNDTTFYNNAVWGCHLLQSQCTEIPSFTVRVYGDTTFYNTV